MSDLIVAADSATNGADTSSLSRQRGQFSIISARAE
jgi:hypothetical protein